MTPSTLTRSYLTHDLGADLERLARAIVPLVAFTYVTGLALGDLVHWLNERLAGRGRSQWLALASPRPPLAVSESPSVYVQHFGRLSRVASATPTFEAVLLPSLTVAQLRQHAARRGFPRTLTRSGRQAELLQVLGAN